MAGPFCVNLPDLRTSATTIRKARGELVCIDVGGPLGAAALALPGSQTAKVLTRIQPQVVAAHTVLLDYLDSRANGLTESADGYRTTDHDASCQIQESGPLPSPSPGSPPSPPR